jgi:hypothetical protein
MLEVFGLAMYIAPLQAPLINTTTNVIVNNYTALRRQGVQVNALTIIPPYLEVRFRMPQLVVAVTVTAAIQGAVLLNLKELIDGLELVAQQMNL